MSSRIIIKNLPKKYTEQRLMKLLSQHGDITQIKYFPSRRFAYVGFATPDAARSAVNFHNDTFIQTSRIEVEAALGLKDENLPRPWSRYSAGSSANQKLLDKISKLKEDASAKKKDNKEKKKLRKSRPTTEKELLEYINVVEKDPTMDPEFAEFLKVMRPKTQRAIWDNEGSGEMGVKKKGRDGKIGGEGGKYMDASSDEGEGGSDEEEISPDADEEKGKSVGKGDAKKEDDSSDASSDDYDESSDSSDSSDDEDNDDDTGSKKKKDKTTTPTGQVSDLDWLRSKMKESAEKDSDSEDSDADDEDDDNDSDNDKREKKKKNSSKKKKNSNDENDDGQLKIYTVKVRGLPYKAKEDTVVDFFDPIPVVEVRFVTDSRKRSRGICFVDFKSAKDHKNALKKHTNKVGDRYIEVMESSVQDVTLAPEDAPQSKIYRTPLGPEDEPLDESGRIFVRNLSYLCTEDDLTTLFEPFGHLAELHMPIDEESKKPKGIAFVSYLLPENALKAFNSLDGTIFMGRLLHLLPARQRQKNSDEMVLTESTDYKKKKDAERKQLSGKAFNWNTLFLRQDAVVDATAQELGVSKGELLDFKSNSDLAVRVALGETKIIEENKSFLKEHGVQLDAFTMKGAKRSRSVILAKNLPFDTNESELRALFSKHGSIEKVLLPPSRTMALISFYEPTEARAAFRSLAYKKFHSEMLYLEWAPQSIFDAHLKQESAIEEPQVPTNKDNDGKRTKQQQKQQSKKNESESSESSESSDSSDSSDDDDNDKEKRKTKVEHVKEIPSQVVHPFEQGAQKSVETDTKNATTVFVKNLNFETTDDALYNLFQSVGTIRSAQVATKKDPHEAGAYLSMGYGFVEFKRPHEARKAVEQLNGSKLQGHRLELKLSTRGGASIAEIASTEPKQKQASNKLIVKNVAFEATKSDLRTLFAAYGDIKTLRLPKKSFDASQHRGFAFIEYSTKEEAKNAVQALSGSTHLYGRRLIVDYAEDNNSMEALRAKASKPRRGNNNDRNNRANKKAKFAF
eukprot:m.7002 g.7002  ORF g.7002 m.7002 type:complete len:1022 (-) comp2691_c0_seq1:348-3413(-)